MEGSQFGFSTNGKNQNKVTSLQHKDYFIKTLASVIGMVDSRWTDEAYQEVITEGQWVAEKRPQWMESKVGWRLQWCSPSSFPLPTVLSAQGLQ